MLDSDDFGLDDDDDTAFIAVATQVEASQNASFAASPRPSKRRKVLRELTYVNKKAPGDFDFHEDDFEEAVISHAQYTNNGYDEELQEPSPKKSRFKVHIPQNAGIFADQILSQTQRDLDEDLGAFRGPIWRKPDPPKPPPRAPSYLLNRFQKAASAGPSRLGLSNVISNAAPKRPQTQQQISKLFKKVPNETNDAALAARLQVEDDDFGLQSATYSRDHGRANIDQSAPPDLDADLCDLPSDAFLSTPEQSPDKPLITVSSQHNPSGMPPPPRLQAQRGPQQGLKQMTLFGAQATQEMSASQLAKKKHSWPLKNREEPPTHHILDTEAMNTWVYPTNLGTVREYQFNIVKRSLFHNTLVALPTGLGKTFIAATVMLNYYRWTNEAKIIFVAPTKPLIAQQMEACYHIVGIPRRDTVLMTGETSPAARNDQWAEKRVFFMTPQTVINDLKTGMCDPKNIVLVVVDEAHKATGGYAYTEIVQFIRRFNESFRVLALTATPGSSVETVQAVIDNLRIARVELRTEESLDIVKYTHDKYSETELFEPNDEQEFVMEYLSKAINPTLERLTSQNAVWSRDPMSLTAYGLTMSRQKWSKSEPGRKAPMAIKGMVNAAFTVLSSLAHGIGLLRYHGIGPWYSSAMTFQKAVESGEHKGKTAKAITEHPDWNKVMGKVRSWTTNPDFVGHPKLQYLREVVLNHFLDAGEGRNGPDAPPSSTRIMIFASYRDSTDEICRVLKKSEPIVRPHVFVGQSGKSGSEGMSQKKQNEVVQNFKSGKFNTLVATSIGEEGLDIGDVDLIICYDSSASPIRMLQRIGRTGRKRVGRVVLLLMKGKEENDYAKAKDNYRHIQKSIAEKSDYNYHDEQNHRILPKGVDPIVDMKVIEIPPENSQPIDTNEKGRRAKTKAKRPAKKFHMPDNVRTGFVKASRLGSDDDDAEVPAAGKRKRAGKKTTGSTTQKRAQPPQIEVVPLPFLEDVTLNPLQERELARKYAMIPEDGADQVVDIPDVTQQSKLFHDLGSTKYVGHGVVAQTICQAILSIAAIDDEKVDRMKRLYEDACATNFDDPAFTLVERESPIASLRHEEVTTQLPSKRKAPPRVRKPKVPPKDKVVAKTCGPVKRTGARDTTDADGDSANEAPESSPEPTPAEFRLATQGIELGSDDTSGSDAEEEPDSELADFIAHSDEMIETYSQSINGDEAGDEIDLAMLMDSSLPKPAKHRRLLSKKKVNPAQQLFSEDEADDIDDDDEAAVEPAVISRQNEKSVAIISDSDDYSEDEIFSTPPAFRTRPISPAGAAPVSSPPVISRGRKRKVVQGDSDDE